MLVIQDVLWSIAVSVVNLLAMPDEGMEVFLMKVVKGLSAIHAIRNFPMNTVSQPMAERLKETGWKEETDFVHAREKGGDWGLMPQFILQDRLGWGEKWEWLPAASIGELLEQLPSSLGGHQDYNLQIHKVTHGKEVIYWVGYYGSKSDDAKGVKWGNNLANVLAEVWLLVEGEKG